VKLVFNINRHGVTSSTLRKTLKMNPQNVRMCKNSASLGNFDVVIRDNFKSDRFPSLMLALMECEVEPFMRIRTSWVPQIAAMVGKSEETVSEWPKMDCRVVAQTLLTSWNRLNDVKDSDLAAKIVTRMNDVHEIIRSSERHSFGAEVINTSECVDGDQAFLVSEAKAVLDMYEQLEMAQSIKELERVLRMCTAYKSCDSETKKKLRLIASKKVILVRDHNVNLVMRMRDMFEANCMDAIVDRARDMIEADQYQEAKKLMMKAESVNELDAVVIEYPELDLEHIYDSRKKAIHVSDKMLSDRRLISLATKVRNEPEVVFKFMCERKMNGGLNDHPDQNARRFFTKDDFLETECDLVCSSSHSEDIVNVQEKLISSAVSVEHLSKITKMGIFSQPILLRDAEKVDLIRLSKENALNSKEWELKKKESEKHGIKLKGACGLNDQNQYAVNWARNTVESFRKVVPNYVMMNDDIKEPEYESDATLETEESETVNRIQNWAEEVSREDEDSVISESEDVSVNDDELLEVDDRPKPRPLIKGKAKAALRRMRNKVSLSDLVAVG